MKLIITLAALTSLVAASSLDPTLGTENSNVARATKGGCKPGFFDTGNGNCVETFNPPGGADSGDFSRDRDSPQSQGGSRGPNSQAQKNRPQQFSGGDPAQSGANLRDAGRERPDSASRGRNFKRDSGKE
ncbi:hypothetical protein HIM_06696 [Hirsutella minnesotensis 3608]|uniref:Uncharacterized protein n=1 Tax=Hirsutella minnesotensis 3608 TaxID=1043627 RepID=A0A0F7ZU06_9HYPO|nr:hypothetical protein HIM_06696 [Hirsutella minnesotensis 3608]